jgi:acyl transferase domain-containing protein/NADPH:quinone reductase-like Zn-dependent oxidoreductase/short-subunit dehydrogenase/ubiquinone/menaquinone biosynthesis C-methylase UbiE/acyl carrier protein
MSAVEPIAIVGIGCRLPGGVRNPDDLWKLLVTGTDAVVEVPEERWHIPATYHPDPRRPGRMNTRWGGFLDHIDRFDAQFFGISPREAELADPQQRLLLEVAYHAIEDAGLTLPALANRRASVHIGICSWDYSFLQLNSESRPSIDAYTNVGSSLCIAANRISYFFNLQGPSLVVDTACSSSLVATHLGCRGIWSGESELAFVGGVNLTLRPELTIGFSKASMLSPDGRCKTFDARANGYVRGEGAGVIILKALSRALADGDRIYALIRATAVNQDGRTAGISLPNQAAQEANIVDALRLADIAPDSVQYVEAHGTGTAVGDPIEASALGAAYGKSRPREDLCVVGSIKSNIGHLEAAAGITGLIKTALCLQHRQIPKSLHFETPNPQIAFDDLRLKVANRLQQWPETHGQPPRAGVNSFGFGGTNGHAILEAAPEPAVTARRPADRADAGGTREAPDRLAWMLPLSARSQSALSDVARRYLDALGDERGLQRAALSDICFSAGVKRTHHDHRLALAAHDKAELAEQLTAFLKGEERANSSTGRAAAAPSQPVFVCSGMGQQWWAMGRQLLAQEPVFRRAVEEVSELFGRLAGWSLLDELTADERASRVQETRVGQPAIFALQVGLAALWRSWGVEPAAVLGHSAGEMAATYIAGVLSLEDAVTVTFHRSRLQHRTAGQGTMLAVGISREEAMQWVARHPRAISIAAINGANSVTLSGDPAVLAEIDKTLAQADMFSRPLRVDVPYHSPKMEPLEAELLEGLRNIQPRPASIPFFSTVTGTALDGPEVDARYWYRNVRRPVLFYDTIAKLIEAGHRTFLELGAHPILRHDIAQCLNEKSSGGATLCSLRRDDRERAALLGSLGRLYTLGADIDWHKLHPADATAIKLPAYPFQAEVHWRESHITRRIRLGESVHPLLGNRLEVPKPSWSATLDTAGLTYLLDHRIGDSIIFPGAGYVEMALAAARETFGPSPCVVENIEFQKFLVLDEGAAPLAQIALDPAASEFEIHSRSDGADGGWDMHAHGCVRPSNGATPTHVDIAAIRGRCPEEFTQAECNQRFAECGYYYGPTFQGITRLWRAEREVIAEIEAPTGVREQLADYRLHPAILDACFQTLLPTLPTWTNWQGMKGETFVPVKIERLRFHATPPTRAFAHTRVAQLGASELKIDIEILDETGLSCVEVQGLVVRAIAYGAQRVRGGLYEYQWQLSLPPTRAGARNSNHLPPPDALAAVVEQEGEVLRRRFDRARYQDEFQSRSRAAAAAYIVRALRELGWTPASRAAQPAAKLAERLGLAPHYQRWLRFMLKELTADEIASSAEPLQLWKAAWDEFPECQAELMLVRLCGENLPAVLRGEIDPLDIIFPEGALTSAEALYQDSPSFRVNNLLVQKAMAEIARRLPKGKALRVLEIGGGTGGMTSFVLPVLPEHCTEYVFTDISSRFTAHAQHKFARFPFVQCRPLDIERDPSEQGFESHSFDVIIASDVLHATSDVRKTLARVKELLGSGGTLIVAELTHPWLFMTSIFGLLKGWWLFDDDVRRDEPCISQQSWKKVLRDAGFGDTVCIADCPAADMAQHSVILARAPERPAAPALAPQGGEAAKTWLIFADAGAASRPSAGAQLARRLAARGDRVIEVAHGAGFRHDAAAGFSVRAGNLDDMRRLVASVGQQLPRLDGIVHLWSLDTEATESLTNDALVSSARLGSIAVMQLVQALSVTDGLAVDNIWLVTHAAQPLDERSGALQLAQSPLWGFGRVAINEYQNVRFRLVDLATRSGEEIAALAQELNDGADAEDEIALHGELRYVRRLLPVTPGTVHGMGQPVEAGEKCFRLEVARPGILDSLHACSAARTPPGPNEVEVEVAAAGLNFMDVMLAMGMLPPDAAADGSAGKLLGLECSGRVTAVGNEVSEFAVGDEVIAAKACTLTSHLTVDTHYVAHKPKHLTLEQAATIPLAFLTAYYSLHTLGRMQRGERVLIHAGSGGVGLAAVQLALQAGATVFATAGSREKRELLTVLGAPDVMDSRTLAFADEVLQATNGEGVDLVLNSLSGEAIDKSLALLRPYGRFIEIGKTDIFKNRKIGMRALRRNISVFVADLLGAMGPQPKMARGMLREVLGRVERRELRPLPLRAFPAARAADAFRAMAQAKHIGKLIIAMADSEGLKVERALPPVAIDGEASYLITGGLGGLGLAVADRLARRGARHLALIGRSAPSPQAQAAVEGLRQRGVEVMVAAADVTDRAQVRDVIAAAQRMGPLKGIMHAAMVLDDAPIERLTEERMWKAMAPKIVGAWNLHALTLDLPLDFFVLFSSLASVTGNPGQANYVAGNAFLDALAYYRRARGLAALTINWGVVGEVGHVAGSRETAQRLERLGMKALSLTDTLDALDELMGSEAVQIGVAEVEWKSLLRSMGARTPARYSGLAGDSGTDKTGASTGSGVHDILEADEAALPSLLEAYIRDLLARAMGTSPARIDSQTSLRNLGLDSLIAVEVRNRINAELGMNVPLAKFMQGDSSIGALAAYAVERLAESNRGDHAKSPGQSSGNGMMHAAEPSPPLSGADAAELLERIDELSEAEIDRHLSELAPEGRS